jgi:hypothetical protein
VVLDEDLMRSKLAADLVEGDRVRCAQPDCLATVLRLERINLYVDYGLRRNGGPKPAPAVRIHLRFLDGERAGQTDACNHHPKDKVLME